MISEISNCNTSWSFNEGTLSFKDRPATRTEIESGLLKYEGEGCACGKGLECPFMLYILEVDDDFENEVEEQDFVEEKESSEFDWNEPEEAKEPFSELLPEPLPEPLSEPLSEIPFEGEKEDSEFGDDGLYDFQEAETYQESDKTSFSEDDLVNDVFSTSDEIYDKESTIEPDSYIDEYQRQAAEITGYADTMVSLKQENRVLKDKLVEMEASFNQQLREISLRQREQGRVENRLEELTKSNQELIWSTLTCLKILKFLPDSHKMNFRNSSDFKKMLEIYKMRIEPQKGGLQ